LSGSQKYRADIDGLRAIAVVAVVFYHAKLGPFTGGYVGVDIFFVISGFLITSIIVQELAEGSFSFGNFYERRIRRIFPALFTVIAVSVAAGWLILTPQDYKQFSLSMIYMAGFISNVFFKRRAGYFGPAAETQPLLHTWSLAVEEQFYVFAPIALLLLFRVAWKSRGPVLLTVAALSLAGAAYGVSHELPFAFYYLQSRAWELIVGMLLAVGVVPVVRSQWVGEALAAAGLAMITWAVLRYTPDTPFPGIAALLPCIGAALIIHSGSQTPTYVSRFLSTRPTVFTGKISYSLYLWHWPLLVFAAYEWGTDFGMRERIALIVLAFVLSILTWAFIEQPARKKESTDLERPVLASGLAAIAACCASGYVIKKMDGFALRLPPPAQAIMRDALLPQKIDKYCAEKSQYRLAIKEACLLGDPSQRGLKFLLWGDSHAFAIADEVSNIAAQLKLKGALIATGGCPPVLGLESISRQTFAKCIDHNASVLESLNNEDVREVIIVARWAHYSEGVGIGEVVNNNIRHFVDGDAAKNRAEFERLLRETILQITATGRHVTILGPVPELLYNLPSTMVKDLMHGKQQDYSLPRQEFDKRQANLLPILATFENIPLVRVLYPAKLFCDDSKCKTIENGTALYKDDNHLSQAGVHLLDGFFREALAPILRP
jgi:peptidoglycan/LPS O-acetylase OafA/YrhL